MCKADIYITKNTYIRVIDSIGNEDRIYLSGLLGLGYPSKVLYQRVINDVYAFFKYSYMSITVVN